MNDTHAEWTRLPERSSRFGLRLMRWLALHLGRGPVRCLLYPISLYFLLAGGPTGSASRTYLTRVFDRPPTFFERLRHLHCFASTVLDRVFLLNDRDTLFDIHIEGREVIEAVMARGDGVFLLGAHVGSFEVLRAAGRWYGGLRVAMAMYPDNAQKINDVLAAINPALVSEIVPIGQLDSMFHLKARLDDGCWVGLMGDRVLGHEAKRVLPFLGAAAGFPLGPLRMAALMRRPVLFMSGIYEGGNRYRLHFSELVDFSAVPRHSRETALRIALDAYVARLEAQCRAAPYNWFNFFDFWADHAG